MPANVFDIIISLFWSVLAVSFINSVVGEYDISSYRLFIATIRNDIIQINFSILIITALRYVTVETTFSLLQFGH